MKTRKLSNLILMSTLLGIAAGFGEAVLPSLPTGYYKSKRERGAKKRKKTESDFFAMAKAEKKRQRRLERNRHA